MGVFLKIWPDCAITTRTYLTVLYSLGFGVFLTEIKELSHKSGNGGAETQQRGDAEVPRLCWSVCPMRAPSSC